MVAVAFAASLNLLGDVMLVNVLGLGLAGAAWATTASQVRSSRLEST